MTCVEVKAVVFDWAGTMVDFGSLAPAAVFQQVFKAKGVEVTVEQARGPMGMAKREHIAAVGAIDEVAQAWRDKFGSDFVDADVEDLYQEFLPLQKQVLQQHCDLIPGAADAAEECRKLGLRIGSSTGYTHELMETVSAEATRQGYTPDLVLCSEDAPKGRPAPFLLFEIAKRFEIYPMWRLIKVDDTVAGIEAGRNAGCWTIGITKTGNLVGKSAEELSALDPEQVEAMCATATQKLEAAGAHFVVDSVAEVPALVSKIDTMCQSGARPGE